MCFLARKALGSSTLSLSISSFSIPQVATDDFRNSHHQSFEGPSADAHVTCSLFVNLATLDGLVMNGHRLIFAESAERRLGFFLDFVSHLCSFFWMSFT